MLTRTLLFCLAACTLASSAQVRRPLFSGAEKPRMYEMHERMRDSSSFRDLYRRFIGPRRILHHDPSSL